MRTSANLFNKIKNKPIDKKWNIGFIDSSLDEILDGKVYNITPLVHDYKKGWFADPFILDVDESYIYLLVEEYYYPIRRGRICKLTIQRNSKKLVSVVPILQLESHLSFPAIIRADDGIYIYPENSRGHGLVMYRYDAASNLCEKVSEISQLPLLDAVITDCFNERFVFATRAPNQCGNVLEQYRMDSEGLSLDATITFPDNIARNAGDWFMYKGKVFRPAQDCNKNYGGSLILQEVRNENDQLSFANIVTIKSNVMRYGIGCHTFNNYKGITVVDIQGYKYPFVAKFWERLILNRKAQ